MATCKDCMHYEVCAKYPYIEFSDVSMDKIRCKDFKDKSKIIELPFEVGDTVYINAWFGNAIPHKINKLRIPFVASSFEDSSDSTADFCLDQFGKTVFLTKEEAEKALKELE